MARLPALLTKHQPDYVLIELGANDGLRGFSPKIINNNLNVMIDNIKSQKTKAILMQIQMPPNYGKRYTKPFSELYSTLSKQKDIPLIPFFLEEVITKPEWMQKDGLHPNAKAQQWIAEFIAIELKKIIK